MLLKKTAFSTGLQLFVIIGNFIFGIVMAHLFGASAKMDAYVVVANFIALVFGLFSHMQSKALLPYLANIKSKDAQKNAVASIFRFNTYLFLCISILLFLFSEQVVFILAPGLEKWQRELAGNCMKISAGYLFIANITSIGQALLEYHLKPFLSQSLNVIRVISLVIVLLLFQQNIGVYVLPFAHLLSLLFLVPFYLFFLKSQNYSLSSKEKLITEDVRKYSVLLFPIFVGQLLTWLIKLSDSFLASFLSDGALSYVSYSLRIVTYFSQLFAGFHVVIYPLLSRLNSDTDDEMHITLFYQGFELLFFLALSLTAFLVMFAPDIVQLLFERNNFTRADTHAVSGLLRGYCLMLLCAPIGTYLANIYYSRQKTKQATIYSVISSVINVVLNFILVTYFDIIGLAIASSIAFLVGNILQASQIGSVNPLYRMQKMLTVVGKGFVAIVVVAGVTFIIAPYLTFDYTDISSFNLFFKLMVIGVIYGFSLLLAALVGRFSFADTLLQKFGWIK